MKDHVDKETFKQIFREYWGEFVKQYPRCKEKDTVIEIISFRIPKRWRVPLDVPAQPVFRI